MFFVCLILQFYLIQFIMTKKAVFITWLQTTKKPIGKPIRNNYFKRSTESDAHSLRVSKSYLPFTTFLPCRFLSILIVCGSSRLVPGRENEKKKCMKLKRPKTFTVWLKRKDSRNWALKSIDSEVFNDVVLVFEAYIFLAIWMPIFTFQTTRPWKLKNTD